MIIVHGALSFGSDADIEGYIAARRHRVEEVRKEPGCLHYSTARDIADPHVLRIVEIWQDEASLERHRDLPETKEAGAAARQFKLRRADMKRYIGAQERRADG